MKSIKAFLSYSYLLISILIINVLQTLIYPFKFVFPKAVRNINRFFADTWWSWCYLLLRDIHGMKVDLDDEHIPVGENAIVICNHQGMGDIPVLFALAFRKKRLGDMKWIVKHALKKVPGLGWGMVYLDCIFVKRNWYADKDKIHAAFDRFSDEQIPIWLVSFPEGTRFTRAKHQKSMEYAQRMGLPRLNNLLLPRTKGFSASLEGLRGHIDAIYDVTIKYPVDDHTVWGVTTKCDKDPIKLHVRRFPVSELPSEDRDVQAWLMDRFIEKDQLLSTDS